MLKFNSKYFTLGVVLFAIEFVIGAYIHDKIIRPFIGDLLIGVMIYCFIKSIINSPTVSTAIFVLLICYLAETMQYFHFLNHMGWQNSKLAQIVFGTTFAWGDLVCYTVGMLMVLLAERLLHSVERF